MRGWLEKELNVQTKQKIIEYVYVNNNINNENVNNNKNKLIFEII